MVHFSGSTSAVVIVSVIVPDQKKYIHYLKRFFNIYRDT